VTNAAIGERRLLELSEHFFDGHRVRRFVVLAFGAAFRLSSLRQAASRDAMAMPFQSQSDWDAVAGRAVALRRRRLRRGVTRSVTIQPMIEGV